MKKPWGGRFEGSPSRFLEEFGASLPVDRRMWAEDIRGSIAHARMLAHQGIISEADADSIESGLAGIYREIREGAFEFDIADEDIHMAIERALIERIGPAGGRLHTARSRNDQVALDTRLYAKARAAELLGATLALRETLLGLAESNQHVIMCGYTHLQRAQPVLFSHHLLAYFWMLARDATRIRHAWEASDVMVLGSAALAGTTFPIDRSIVADSLGFSEVSANSMDSVSDRDFLLDLTYACTVTMVHLSRLCEELVMWSSEEFGFVRMDDTYSTGSSIMPQKKNPDFAELTRGKTGRVLGDLVGLLTMLKGLPLAYNKDMQEDKEGAFDAIDTTLGCLVVVEGMLSTMHVDSERMRTAAHGGFMAATDLADHLVSSGIPFRDAHEVVGKLVLELEKQGRTLQQLTAEDFAAINPAFGQGAPAVVDITEVVSRRVSQGGTGHQALVQQLERCRDVLDADATWLETVAE
ncbi:MAG: argininosuccinate lyase [Coriobacteriia bacterium]|nr:argininosuccinate lyase [Coriobacteriia bacterium]